MPCEGCNNEIEIEIEKEIPSVHACKHMHGHITERLLIGKATSNPNGFRAGRVMNAGSGSDVRILLSCAIYDLFSKGGRDPKIGWSFGTRLWIAIL
jgi:hypothetical protein